MDELIKAVYSSLSDFVAALQAAEAAGLEIHYSLGPDNNQALSITDFFVRQNIDVTSQIEAIKSGKTQPVAEVQT